MATLHHPRRSRKPRPHPADCTCSICDDAHAAALARRLGLDDAQLGANLPQAALWPSSEDLDAYAWSIGPDGSYIAPFLAADVPADADEPQPAGSPFSRDELEEAGRRSDEIPLRDPDGWDPAEIQQAGQGSGHGYGEDLDEMAADSARLDRYERGCLPV